MKAYDAQFTRLGSPEVRGSTIAVAAALLVIFAVKFDDGSLAAAGVPVVCGAAGLLLRWTAMPLAVVVTLAYFLFFPIGLPLGAPTRAPLSESYFQLNDLLLAAALLVYLSAQYRVFELTLPPFDHPRQPDPGGGLRVFSFIAAAVLAGQVIWALILNVEPHFGADAPARWKPSTGALFRGETAPSTQSAEVSRFLVMSVLFLGLLAVLRFVFWYLRHRSLSELEARMLLTDVQWRLNRRELARLETWRADRLGHLTPRSPMSDFAFRWIARSLVLALFAAFLVWILYIYNSVP